MRVAVLVLAALAAACAKQEPPRDAQPPFTVTETDSARIVRLEREARAIVRIDGCDAAAQCLTAAVGERPCGGPRDYIVYCARSTDTTALHRKLAELRQAEIEWNRKSGAMSTCEFREPPPTTLVAGACRAR